MEQLKHHVTDNQRKHALTTNQGVKIAEDEFSLKMGLRGPTLMEDFHFREKMTTLIMNEFLKGLFMHAELALMVIFSFMNR